jgi:CHAT domain-containing protein
MTPSSCVNPLVKLMLPWLVLLCPTVSGLCDAIAPQSDPKEEKAYQLYLSGETAEGIKALSAIVADSVKTGEEATVLRYAQDLLDMCTRALDVACVQSETDRVVNLFAKHLKEPFPRGAEAQIWGTYYIGNRAFLSGDQDQMRQVLDRFFQETSDSPLDYVSYVRRHLLIAKMRLVLQQRREAIGAVNDVLSMIATTTKPQGWRFFIADYLSQCIGILTDAGDVSRAAALYDVAGNFIARSFSRATPENFYFRIQEADLLLRVGNTRASTAASKEALEALKSQKLRPEIEKYLEEVTRNTAALSLALSGEYKGALEQVNQNPINQDLLAIRARGSLESRNEVAFMATRAYVRGAAGLRPDPMDAALLKAPLNLKVDALTAQGLDLYRRVGYAFVLADTDINQARAELREVGRRVVALQASAPRSGFNIFTRTDPIISLVVNVVLAAISNGGAPDPVDADLALKMIDLGTRNARSLDSEVLTLLASAPTTDTRNKIHDALRLYANRNRAEQKDVARIVQLLEQTPYDAAALEPLQRDYIQRTVYVDYSRGLKGAERLLALLPPTEAGGQLLVDVNELQHVLRPHEAYLLLSNVLGTNLLYECITREKALLYYAAFDSKQYGLDTRILEDALTAVRPPSSLDSEYPTGAASRLYDTVFRPFEGCLSEGDTILWAPDTSMLPVPLAALLRSLPKANEPLNKADWFVKHYNVSYVKSPASLVALRRMEEVTASAPSGFLGIGDPLLGAPSTNLDAVAQVSASRSGALGSPDNGINSLPALPDTREELQSSAKFFNGSVLLLGASATEANFRRQPLSEFRYLSFATHSVLREEIAGVTEPTLVLTPTTSKDREDDGMLTAPEISDLTLHASFVALSACSTANYDFAKYAGEITAFSTALAIAGVPATMATLWPVESDASRRITSRLFQQLASAEASGSALALATAQREYLASPSDAAHANPRFWSPFIVLGDGGNRLNEREHGVPEIKITNMAQVTVGGGELFTLSSLNAGTLIANGFGDHGNTRYAAITTALDEQGHSLWRNRDYVGLASRAVVQLPSGVLSASTLGMEKSEGLKTLVLSITGYDGRQLATLAKRLDVQQLVPLSAATVGHDDAIVAVWESNQGAASSGPTKQGVLLLRVSGADKVTQEQYIDLSGKDISTYSVRGAIGVSSDGIVLTVSAPPMTLNGAFQIDEGAERTACVVHPNSWIIWLDRRTLKVIDEKLLEDVEIRGEMTFRNGRLLVSLTTREKCTTGSRAALVQIENVSEVTKLFEEDEASEVTASATTELGDGDIVLTGTRRRHVDVEPAEKRGIAGMQNAIKDAVDAITRSSFSSGVREDLFVYLLDRSGNVRARKDISFGGDVYMDAATARDDSAIVGGSIGNEAYVITLSMPSPIGAGSP